MIATTESAGIYEPVKSVNEPIKTYEPGSKERQDLQLKYDEIANQSIEIPLLINGEEIILIFF